MDLFAYQLQKNKRIVTWTQLIGLLNDPGTVIMPHLHGACYIWPNGNVGFGHKTKNCIKNGRMC